MANKKKGEKQARQRKPLIMVFGEDDNDTCTVRSLIMAIWDGARDKASTPQQGSKDKSVLPTGAKKVFPRPDIRTFRSPLVLIRGRELAQQRKNAAAIKSVVAAQAVVNDVKAVIAHEDCDDLEPAHETAAIQIETRLRDEGAPNPCAVTPAWEMEAWWYLWPDAVAAVHPGWRKLARHGQEVGRIRDAKEQLRRDLRPVNVKPGRGRDYVESDSRTIAEYVRTSGCIFSPTANSASFSRFRDQVLKLATTEL